MEHKSRLDKAIAGLTKILERNKGFKNIKLGKEIIRIGNSEPGLWGTIAYLVIILITPTSLIIYEYAKGREHYFSLIILTVFLFVFGRNLFILVRSQNVTALDLQAKRLEVKNLNGIFGTLIPSQQVAFDEMSKIEIVDRSTGRLNSWLELTLYKKDGKRVILCSFNDKYPDSFIAGKVRFLFEVIIWMEKKH